MELTLRRWESKKKKEIGMTDGGIKLKEKIKFSDLSLGLQIPIVLAWIVGFIYVAFFISGIMVGFGVL